MCTRGVWQLSELAIHYCKAGGSSAGVRTFLREQLPAFTTANPQLRITAKQLNGHHPRAVGTYINGRMHTFPLRNLSPTEVLAAVKSLRNRRGRKLVNLKRQFYPQTTTASLQGRWRPGLFN